MPGFAENIQFYGKISFTPGDHLTVQAAAFQHKGTGAFFRLAFDQIPGTGRTDLFIRVKDKCYGIFFQKSYGVQSLESEYPHHQPAFHIDHTGTVTMGRIFPVPVKVGIFREYGVHMTHQKDLFVQWRVAEGSDHKMIAEFGLFYGPARDHVGLEYGLYETRHPVHPFFVMA